MKLEKAKNWAKEHKKELVIGAVSFVGGIVLCKTVVDFSKITGFLTGNRMYTVAVDFGTEEAAKAAKDYFGNFSGLIDRSYYGYNHKGETVVDVVSKFVNEKPDCLYGVIIDRKILET